MRVFVTGIGLNCGLGSLNESWSRILAHHTAIRGIQPFSEIPPYPLALINTYPTNLENLVKNILKSALIDAKLTLPLPNCGIVIGSSRGCQGSWEQFIRQGMITHWLESLPYQPSRLVAESIKAIGNVFSPMAACATGIWSIAQAYELIQQGQCEQAIAGAVEAPITPLTLAGFERMGALAKKGCYPFDKNREGLVLGEGGAILVLESEKSLKKRNIKPYGEILGFGLTCDAAHVSAPSVNLNSAAIAIKQCLERSHLSPDNIDFIHAHGTGTRLNDQREAQLIRSLFPSNVAVSSTKGATGHTLGASGAIGVAFCLLSLKYQQLPPCIGLRDPEFDLNVVRYSQSLPVNAVLCFSFGFGGQNAVIALGR